MIRMVLFRLVAIVTQLYIPICFFWRVQPLGQPRTGAARIFPYLTALLCLPLFWELEMYWRGGVSIFSTFWRFFYRAFAYYVYVRCVKQTSRPISIYLALLLTSIYTTLQVCAQLLLNMNRESFLSNFFFFPTIALCAWLLPLHRKSSLSWSRVAVLAVVIACLLYTKTTLFSYRLHDGGHSPSTPMYFALLHLFLLLFLLSFERYVSEASQVEENRMQELANHYILQSLLSRQAGAEEIRALHHDMKNHLMAIQGMSQRGDTQEITRYTGDLLDHIVEYNQSQHTGNRLLDGLLEDKIRQASQYHISVEVSVDFRPCSHLDGVDVCTIFANALDNAVEAAKQVPDPDQRYIRIYSDTMAHGLLMTIENSYTGTVQQQGDRLYTTKSDPHLHGFGLSNIKKAAAKYEAQVATQARPDGCFSLTILFPLA